MKPAPRAVAGALVLGLALVACGDDSPSSSSSSTSREATATTLAGPSTTTTAATTTSGAPAGSVPADGPEAAAAEAYEVVFDSATPFDAKAAHLEDAESLRPVVEAYIAAAGRFGGIRLEPTAVAVDGSTAAVTYDVYFGTTRQYDGLSGTVEVRSGTWVVTRDEFCGFMSSARVPCPA